MHSFSPARFKFESEVLDVGERDGGKEVREIVTGGAASIQRFESRLGWRGDNEGKGFERWVNQGSFKRSFSPAGKDESTPSESPTHAKEVPPLPRIQLSPPTGHFNAGKPGPRQPKFTDISLKEGKRHVFQF